MKFNQLERRPLYHNLGYIYEGNLTCWCLWSVLVLVPQPLSRPLVWLCLFPCFGLSTGCVWWHWHVHCPAVTSLFLMAVCMDLCLVSPLSSQELEVKSRSRRPATSASLVIRLATGWRCSLVPRELLVLGDALLPRYPMVGSMSLPLQIPTFTVSRTMLMHIFLYLFSAYSCMQHLSRTLSHLPSFFNSL